MAKAVTEQKALENNYKFDNFSQHTGATISGKLFVMV